MKEKWNTFKRELNDLLIPYLDKNIVLFGCNRSTYFIIDYLEKVYNKKVKAVIDLWERSPSSTILHLYSFFYIYDKDDVILNLTDKNVIEEFENAGEDWENIRYSKEQIIDIIPLLYGDDYNDIDYYSWLEYKYNIDFLGNIRRKYLDGEDAHGYYPTDFKVLSQVFDKEVIREEDAAFDFGCGKGAFMSMLIQFGFSKVGGVEYTKKVYDTLITNCGLLGLDCFENQSHTSKDGVYVYNMDAGCLGEVLDDYNWFCLFNPFGLIKTKEVINSIFQSMDRKPRKIHILYAEPMGDSILMDSGKFTRKEYKIDFYEGTYWTYLYTSNL